MHTSATNRSPMLVLLAVFGLTMGCGVEDDVDVTDDVLIDEGALATSVVIYNPGPHPVGTQPLVVDVAYASVSNNARVQAFPYRPGGNGGIKNQLWVFEPTFGGWYRARNGHSGKCLDRFRNGNGSGVTQFTCNRNASQDWRVGPDLSQIPEIASLQNRFDNRCLHVDSLTSGATMLVRTCVGNDYRQAWVRRAPW